LSPQDTTNIEKAYQKLCDSLQFAPKQSIPGGHWKNYVPCWEKECETFCRFFLQAQQGLTPTELISSRDVGLCSQFD